MCVSWSWPHGCAGRTAHRGGQPRRADRSACHAHHRPRSVGPPHPRRARRAVGRHLARRQRARRLRRPDQPAPGRRQGPVQALARRPAHRPGPPHQCRRRGRGLRGRATGPRSTTGAGCWSATAPRCGSSTSRARGPSPARATALAAGHPRPREPSPGRAFGQGRPGAGRAGPARRRGRHRRPPSAPCWPTTASPRTTSAPTPPTACTSTRSAPARRVWSGSRAGRRAAPHVGGAGRPVHDALRGRQRVVGAGRRRGVRLSPAPAACSGSGAAARRRHPGGRCRSAS